MTQYTLPRERASDVLELCRGYGISGATMFPGYDGAAREVHEEELMFADYRWQMGDGRSRCDTDTDE